MEQLVHFDKITWHYKGLFKVQIPQTNPIKVALWQKVVSYLIQLSPVKQFPFSKTYSKLIYKGRTCCVCCELIGPCPCSLGTAKCNIHIWSGDISTWSIFSEILTTTKTKNHQFDNFVITGGTLTYHYENLQWHRWQQSWQIDNLLFLEIQTAKSCPSMGCPLWVPVCPMFYLMTVLLYSKVCYIWWQL